MALPIRAIPELKGEVAARFVRAAEMAERGPKVDFSQQFEAMRRILAKANL